MKKMTVQMILEANAAKLNATLQRTEGRMKTFGGNTRREFDRIKSTTRSLEKTIASLGISIGATLLIKQSAELDKSLIRIGQTAGESRVKVEGLRKEFFRMSKETGQSVEDLKAGLDNAVQSGLSFREALPVTDAVNKAMAVTGAKADQLTAGLTVAATAFQFDLATPGKALLLLDKMTVAGRQGNAELENLSSIFARIGVNASRAGMNFDQTLGFIEGLSLLERQPERLATLADSTLRLFTNIKYLSRAQKTTGVRFFDEAGGRRDPLSILGDIKKKYDQLQTARQKEMFMGAAFKGADLDTIKGLQALMTGDMLNKVMQINREINKAPGTLVKDLPDALKNAPDQIGRIKSSLREAADAFIRPLNAGITRVIKKLLDAPKDGGMGLSGNQLVAGGAALAVGTYVAARLSGGALKKYLGKLGGTGVGIAEGKAIEAATGVQPVFVTNMPGSFPGGQESPLKKTGPGALNKLWPFLAGGAAFGTTAGSAMLAQKYLSDGGSAGNLGLALHGMPEMTSFSEIEDIANKIQVRNEINVRIDKDGRASVETSGPAKNKINLERGSFFSH